MQSVTVTFENVHSLSMFELRKELERRGKWNLVDPSVLEKKKKAQTAMANKIDEDSIKHLIYRGTKDTEEEEEEEVDPSKVISQHNALKAMIKILLEEKEEKERKELERLKLEQGAEQDEKEVAEVSVKAKDTEEEETEKETKKELEKVMKNERRAESLSERLKREREERKKEAIARSKARQANPNYYKDKKEANEIREKEIEEKKRLKEGKQEGEEEGEEVPTSTFASMGDETGKSQKERYGEEKDEKERSKEEEEEGEGEETGGASFDPFALKTRGKLFIR